MIPDKIYLHEEDFTRIYTQPSSTIDDDIEYILKEALLEWARELNETYHKEYEISKYTCGEHWGQMVAFQKVIDKLNEM